MRRKVSSCALGLVLASLGVLGAGGAPSRAQDERAALARFVGHYELAVSRSRGREIIEDAIERGIDGMFFIARDIARGKILAKNRLSPTLDIAVASTRVTVAYEEGRAAFTARIDGGRVRATDPEGDEVFCTHRFRNGRLVELFENDEGERENVFALSGDGEHVFMSVTLRSEQLPRDIRYRLRYRRR